MRIRALKQEDAHGMLEWMSDKEVYTKYAYSFEKLGFYEVIKFIEEANQSLDSKNPRQIHYAIADDDDNYLGTISLKNIDMINLSAEYAICLKRSEHGTGIAKEATDMLLEIAFQELKLNRIYLDVFSDNIRAIRFYEKYGFHYEGEFREHIFIRGEWKSLKWYSLLKREYRGDKSY